MDGERNQRRIVWQEWSEDNNRHRPIETSRQQRLQHHQRLHSARPEEKERNSIPGHSIHPNDVPRNQPRDQTSCCPRKRGILLGREVKRGNPPRQQDEKDNRSKTTQPRTIAFFHKYFLS